MKTKTEKSLRNLCLMSFFVSVFRFHISAFPLRQARKHLLKLTAIRKRSLRPVARHRNMSSRNRESRSIQSFSLFDQCHREGARKGISASGFVNDLHSGWSNGSRAILGRHGTAAIAPPDESRFVSAGD
jgi:hypothetical protein